MSNQNQQQQPNKEQLMQANANLLENAQLFHSANKKLAEKLATAQLDLSLAHAQVEMLQAQISALTQQQQPQTDEQVAQVNRAQRRDKNGNRNKNR